ncbi:SDR family oxidoreductase [Asticcacaulis sp. ZE23SCel15]|uniref:SDR family NAD(P)-dependent oxidoreductase n=1 Tax=Asticcacaulis sp. ZE23SCel15 TaxID=3059027 RepID=UPI00265F44AA|nr:SDR family NAD(P)-dependent oxidoreductase [Asticcacaulis sp. ZE23SCel15]WKL58334.1 SDR family oxidoreductase [Asticcacaulis sp. ZE23SCel15]
MRHVIVTGGSRGLGAVMIEGLLADGYRVSTCSRKKTDNIARLEAHPEYGPYFFWQACEVGEADQVDAFVEAAVAWAGEDGLWGLVNNAGVAQAGILASFPNVESERIIKINLLGTIQMARAASKVMLAQKPSENQGGRIINISSIIGTRGYNGLSAYSASKAGVDGFSRALARELGRRQITVNSVAPGYVATEMSSTLSPSQLKQIVGRTPLGRLADEDDILNAVRFFLSDGARMITGQTLIIDGGIST